MLISHYRIDPSAERRLRAAASTIRLVTCAGRHIAEPFRSAWAVGIPDDRMDVGGPVRKTLSQNAVHGAGRLYSPKNDELRGWESHLEKKAMTLLECDPGVMRYCAQPMTFRYTLDGKPRHYTPDLFICRKHQDQVVEVKPRRTADKEEHRHRFALFDTFFRTFGISFFVLDESVIDVEPRQRNCRFLLRYHDEQLSARDLDALRDVWRSGPAPVEHLATSLEGARPHDRVYASILRGHAKVDHRMPLGKDSLVWGL